MQRLHEARGEFFDYDPLTGIHEYYEETSDGKIHIHSYQDVEPIMNWCKALANEGLPDANFRGEGWLYAYMPAIVIADMMKRGINPNDQNDVGRVVYEMNTTYPYFKTTHRHHAIK